MLIVEALDAAFAERFWAFVEDGAYEIRERSEGGKILYRFQKPETVGFPAMLELFSRSPEGLSLAEDVHLTPLPIDEAGASLSAILLDDACYGFLKSMVRTVDGIPFSTKRRSSRLRGAPCQHSAVRRYSRFSAKMALANQHEQMVHIGRKPDLYRGFTARLRRWFF